MLTKNGRHSLERMQLGNYRLLELLKSGGFASVYLGEHIHLNTRVALKILHNDLADEAHIYHFLREARLHAGMLHPSIVRALDFGLEQQVPFLVMDYAPHGSLFEYFSQPGPLSATTILPFVLQISSSLAYLHSQGVMHCDVKPQNVLLGPTFQVWLSDFGVAQAAQPWASHKALHAFGTALYAAPELIEGAPRTASDQYSLAVMIYTWLCGRSPFQGTSSQLCQQHLLLSPPTLTSHVPEISPGVEHVVLRALSKDPYRRFPHIQDFSQAFEQAVQSSERKTDSLPLINSFPLSSYLSDNRLRLYVDEDEMKNIPTTSSIDHIKKPLR
jgi:serine/threonine protein kinase